MVETEGAASGLPAKKFCLTVLKNFVREPRSNSLVSGIEKAWMRGLGGGG